MPSRHWIVKDIGLICFIAIVLAIGIGLYRFFDNREKQQWREGENYIETVSNRY